MTVRERSGLGAVARPLDDDDANGTGGARPPEHASLLSREEDDVNASG